jgi:hypothetical protein
MIERGVAPSAEPYSPLRRTALVLSGTGTAGAYHAGVLRALHEAGVKLDIVAGRGAGVIGALFAAVDGAPRLWDERGLWRAPSARTFYPWRRSLRALWLALIIAVAIVALPLAAVALGLIVFPIDFVLKMVGLSGAGSLVSGYLRIAERLFAPDGLPTWLPRLAVLVLGGAAIGALAAGYRRATARTRRGNFWWRLMSSPMTSTQAVDLTWSALWDLVRGAAQLKEPSHQDLARRYTELLADNLGQPGFRELLIVVHDVDAGRDLVCALVAESRRAGLVRRATIEATEARRAEVLDLAGLGRDHLADAVAGALTVPIVNEYHELQFAPEAYWRGERHRIGDRPGAIARLLDELVDLGVEQVIVVSAAPESPGPHALGAARNDGRGRVGEWLQSSEAAALHDLIARARTNGPRVFPIQPAHNPVGPFDFDGGIDERSARRLTLAELMHRGYEDAYHQFVEPVVGASGDRVGQAI